MSPVTSNERERDNVDWSRFGLGPDNSTSYQRNVRAPGDLPRDESDIQYGPGGHQPTDVNEIFAQEQVIK